MDKQRILHDRIYAVIIRYVAPGIISSAGFSLYVLADTYFVANGVGSHALAALNLVLPFFNLIFGFGVMLGIGAATLFSVAAGAGRDLREDNSFTLAFWSTVVIGTLITLFGTIFAKPLTQALGADQETMHYATVYVRTIAAFSLPFMFSSIFINFIRNDGAPKLAAIGLLCSSLSNIVLDYIFIYFCNWGMFGAAFASGLSPLITLCVLSRHLVKKRNSFHLFKPQMDGRKLWRVVTIGLPNFLTEISGGLVVMLFNFSMLRLTDNMGVAAYGVITNLAVLAIAVFNGIGQGIQPVISTNFGAGQTLRIRQTIRFALILAFCAAAVIYLVVWLFGEPIVALFNKDGGQALADLALQGLHIYFLAFFAMGPNTLLAVSFTAMTRPRPSLLINALRGYILIFAAILLMPRFFGVPGVWWSMPVAEFLTLCVAVICLRRISRDLLTEKQAAAQ